MPFFVLAIFNDRFVNLNPYPFLFYVFMWIPAALIEVRCLSPAVYERPREKLHYRKQAMRGAG